MPSQRNHYEETIMKDLSKSWKLIALFALAAIVYLGYVGRSRVSAQGVTTPTVPTITFETPSVVTGGQQYFLGEFVNHGSGAATLGIKAIDTAGNNFPIVNPTLTLAPGATGDFLFFHSLPGTTSTVPGLGAVVNPAVTRFQITVTPSSNETPADVGANGFVMNTNGTASLLVYTCEGVALPAAEIEFPTPPPATICSPVTFNLTTKPHTL